MKPGDCVNMTTTEIDNLRTEKEKELLSAQDALSKLEIADLELAKQIVLLQGQRKDLQIGISKGKQVVRTLALDVRILTNKFFQAKDNR